MKKTKSTKMTQSELARVLGISRQLVAFHVKGGNAPSLDDTEGWVAFLEEIGREGSLPKELRKAIATQRLRLIKAQADRTELENGAKRKEYVAWDLVHRFVTNLVGNAFFGELERMREEFPVTLEGKTKIQIYEEVNRQIEEVKKTLTRHLDAWGKANRKKEK
jgi:phage terminase Nu1 subunit (DNA packaging protein)